MNMQTTDISLPGMIKSTASEFDNYSVKYHKADLEDLGDVTLLQEIETRALRGDGIVVLTRNTFTFNFQYFVVIQYMERNGE